MRKTITTSILYMLITGVILGIGYPLLVTGLAHVLFPRQAGGDLMTHNGTIVGSYLIGQPFTGPTYFHSRPSAAGAGYDATASSGSNLGPSSKALIQRIQSSVTAEQSGSSSNDVPRPSHAPESVDSSVPIDLVTASGSGLDPDISPAAAYYQITRIAQQRHMSESSVNKLIEKNTTPRQFGLLGEPRVNVLSLNMALDDASSHQHRHP